MVIHIIYSKWALVVRKLCELPYAELVSRTSNSKAGDVESGGFAILLEAGEAVITGSAKESKVFLTWIRLARLKLL